MQKLPLPDKIQNSPILRIGLEFFYYAFMELTTCRAIGMAEGYIPWVAIKQWADEYDVIDEQREDLFYHILKMDEAYLIHRSKQADKQISRAKHGKH
jgi:hypothetical protein